MKITYNLTLDEALAKRFEKIMAEVHGVAVSEDYATDMFLFLREKVVPEFKSFLARGGYQITRINEDRDSYDDLIGLCCSDDCHDCETIEGPCEACETGCPCVEVWSSANTD